MKYKFLNNEHIYMEIREGVLLARSKEEVIDRKAAEKIIDQRLFFVEKQAFPMLFDISSVKEVTKEARETLASEKANQYTIALAVIVRHPVTRTIANFFLKFQQPRYPFRLFTDLESAREWLEKYQSNT